MPPSRHPGAWLRVARTVARPAAREQREIGEAAMAAVCVAQVDVECHITRRQRETLSVARECIDIASGAVSVGELSQFFGAQTLATCGPNATERGGVPTCIV